MSDEKLAFLEQPEAAPSPEPAPAEPVAEAKPQEQAEPSTSVDDRPRDPETGRFVPIGALLDEREKRQAETRKREELEQQLQRYQQPEQEEYVPTDPREIIQFTLAEQQRVAFNERLNMSELMARQAHGDDTVAAAQKAFIEASARDPNLGSQLQGQVHPYDFVIKWHKQHQLMSEIGQDPEAYKEKVRQQLLQELQAQGVSPSQASQQPPPSVVGRPAAAKAGFVPSGPGQAFDSLFKG